MARTRSRRWLMAAATPLMLMGGLAVPVLGGTTASADTMHQLTQEVVNTPSIASLIGPATVAPTASGLFYIDVQIDTGGQLAAEQAAVQAIYTPGSSTYHQFFTDSTWNAEFGVPTATYDSVLTWATAHGLTKVYNDQSQDLIELEGTAAEVDATFSGATAGTQLTEQDWSFPYNGKTYTYYANSVAPTVPADVSAVQGLTNVGFIEKEAVSGKSTPTDQGCAAPNELPDTFDTSGEECLGALNYADLRTVYNTGTTYTGAGQALAVNGDGDMEGPSADVHEYETLNGLPSVNTVFVNTDFDDCVASGPQASDCDTSGEGEWALDSDSSTAMAPGVSTLYYFFPAALGNASGFQAWAEYNVKTDGPIPMQENASWGECEAYGTTFVPIADGTMVTYTAAFVKAAGLGKTQFVSAGDLGAGCLLTGLNGVTPGGPPQTQWPCSSPWVVCVGGTVLYTNDETGSSEQRAGLGGTCTPDTGVNTLNNCAEEAWSHTGGGTSYINAAPSWQQSMPDSSTVIVGQCVVQPDGSPYSSATQCRGVPDVTALSGDITCCQGTGGNGFSDVEGGNPDGANGCTTSTGCPGSATEDGGTSLADPLWEGMWADINSDPQASSWGFADPLLYQIGDLTGGPTSEDSCAFFDVQVDETGSNFGFPAEPRNSATDPTGWDYVSGLGSPNVQCIETELAANQLSSNTPEAPGAALLLVVPGFALAAVAIRRRRRAQPAG